jgi:hypothetical protein
MKFDTIGLPLEAIFNQPYISRYSFKVLIEDALAHFHCL